VTRTEGTLLSGRIRYTQAAGGHRTGIEPVLLAAVVPARQGERVIEAGTGAGAGLLCLNYRIPALRGIGIERDPELAALARANLQANGFDGSAIIATDITCPPLSGPFDHAFANPPWRAVADTPSPDPGRRLAYEAPPGLLPAWIASLVRLLRPRGSLSLILPAAALDAALEASRAASCGSLRVLPLWPRAGRPAKLFILRAIRGGRGPTVLLPGLVLHEANGFSEAANLVLRDGAAIDL
jgi:tRNA1(Val) A37 N6-methylase TrmN6